MKALVTVTLAALLFSTGIAQAAEKKTTQEAAAPTAAAAAAAKLDINRATTQELVGVPGIGERMAQAIVALRARKGSFTRVEDLLEVPGIKEKKLASLTAHLTVAQVPSPGTTPQSK